MARYVGIDPGRNGERLGLFIDVCRAVQHAHQKGIIHRDIKPTNVLVTQQDGKPVPKIIDFGVAKATQQRLTEKTLFTEHRQLVGTPEYMSPEQATFCETDVDTRSDIYSLGVLLYELLVGTTPFDAESLRSHGYDEICRVIRESEPPTPSKRLSTLGDAVTDISKHRHVEPAALRRLLRGDLDWIVMKALEKDRARRYETTHGLARDIERHLHDEPVRARPPTARYRLKKFVRKHRGPVAAAIAVIVALLGGLILAATGFLAATRQRDETRRHLYVSDVNSAYHAWEEGNANRVHALLSRHLLQPGEEDLRGFEWHWLWGRYQRTMMAPTLKHDMITSLAFSPNGNVLASTIYNSTVKLWDVATLTEIRTLHLKTGSSGFGVAFSPDGSVLACGSDDHIVRLWEVASGRLLDRLRHSDNVASVSFSPNGEILAAGCGAYVGGEVKLWNFATRAELTTLSGHTAGVSSVVFSPDGKTLASGSWDRSVKLWDVETRTETATLHGHTNRVAAVAFSPDGSMLATGGPDSTVKLWNVDTRKIEVELAESTGSVTSLAFSPDGRMLVIAGRDSRLWLCDLTKKKHETFFTGHSDIISSVVISPDGAKIATGSSDNHIRISDAPRLSASRFDKGHSNWTTRIAISPANDPLLVIVAGESVGASPSGEILIWDLAAGEKLRLATEVAGPVNCVALSPDGKTLATGESRLQPSRSVIRIWDLPSGRLRRTLDQDHVGGVISLAFSPGGELLASGDWGRADVGTPNSENWGATIHLRDARSFELRKSLRTPRFATTSMQFSPDGECLAVGGGQWGAGAIKLWKPSSAEEPVTLAVPRRIVWDVAFSPSGKVLASIDWGGRVSLWDVGSARQTLAFDAHVDHAMAVAFSPDGRTLASGSLDKTVKLWHAPTGSELVALEADVQISSVAFSPDGSTLAAGGRDRSVTLWHVNAEKEVLRVEQE